MQRTLRLAVYLARKEKANLQVVKLGAMLHQLHDANKVKKFLEKIMIDKEIMKQIVHCVDCSRRSTVHKAKTIEAKIVFDADKLQVVGPFGIIRGISCDVVPPRNKTFRQALNHTKEVEQSCYEMLQTKTARRLAEQPHRYVVNFWKIFDKWDQVEL